METAPPFRPAPTARVEAWPEALVDGIDHPTMATRVTVRPSRVDVENVAYVNTWPRSVRERAATAGEEGFPEWPRIDARLDAPSVEDGALPALRELLEVARRAEAAAGGSGVGGSGAGVFHLRVASDVPFAEVERVLRTAGLAGYSTPHLLLGSDEGALVSVPWPHGSRSAGPSLESLRAAVAAVERGEEPSLPEDLSSGPRIELGADGFEVSAAGQPIACADPRACLEALGDAANITLVVGSEIPFDDVAPWLQRLPGDRARVISTP